MNDITIEKLAPLVRMHTAVMACAIFFGIAGGALVLSLVLYFIANKLSKDQTHSNINNTKVVLDQLANLKLKQGEVKSEQSIFIVNEAPEVTSLASLVKSTQDPKTQTRANSSVKFEVTVCGKAISPTIPCCSALQQIASSRQSGFSVRKGMFYGTPGTGKTFAAQVIAAKTNAIILKCSARDLMGDGSEFLTMKKAELAALIQYINTKYNRDVLFLIDEFDKIWSQQTERLDGCRDDLTTLFENRLSDPKLSSEFLGFFDENFAGPNTRNMMFITGNEKQWFTDLVERADLSKAHTALEVFINRLSRGNDKTNKGYKFQPLNQEDARHCLQTMLAAYNKYNALDNENQTRIQSRISNRIDSAQNGTTYTLRAMNNIISEYLVKDYNNRNTLVQLINKVLAEISSINKTGFKQFKQQFSQFSQDTQQQLVTIRQNIQSSVDGLQINVQDQSVEIFNAYQETFKNILKAVLISRKGEFTKDGITSNIDIEQFIKDKLQFQHDIVHEQGFVKFIKDALCKLDCKIIQNYIHTIPGDHNQISKDQDITRFTAKIQGAHDKNKSPLKPKALKKAVDKLLPPNTQFAAERLDSKKYHQL